MKNNYGTEYIYIKNDGSYANIYYVFKIYNNDEQTFYYILKDKDKNNIAKLKLLTNKNGKVVNVEIVNN